MTSFFEKLKNIFTSDRSETPVEPTEKKESDKGTRSKPATVAAHTKPRRPVQKPAPQTSAAEPEKTASPKPEKPVTPPKSRNRKPPQKKAPQKRKSGKSSRAVNKHGIPVFEKETDFTALFKDEPEEAPLPPRRPPEKSPKPFFPEDEKKPEGVRKANKHGIPIFEEDTDFRKFFKDGPGDAGRPSGSPKRMRYADAKKETDFAELLEKSLSGKPREHLIQEKTGGLPPERPLTRKEKIAAYPPPQGEIDLHGCTAAEATDRTEAFIRESRRRGKRTVMIIVGKGLHSEGRPVLPDAVEAKLTELRQKNWVLTSEWERGRKRRSGAVIVYLKTPYR
jgi:DNA-nicking Smr family endonuclease